MTMENDPHGGEDMPTITTHQMPQNMNTVVGIDAVSTLVHSFSSMITAMESRISDQLRSNAAEAKDRYSKWEREFEKYQDKNDQRITKLEELVAAHLGKEHEEEVRFDARVQPIRATADVIFRNWKTVIVGLLALLGLGTSISAALQALLQ